jgi:hypothetical protein
MWREENARENGVERWKGSGDHRDSAKELGFIGRAWARRRTHCMVLEKWGEFHFPTTAPTRDAHNHRHLY